MTCHCPARGKHCLLHTESTYSTHIFPLDRSTTGKMVPKLSHHASTETSKCIFRKGLMMSSKVTHAPRSANSRREAEGGYKRKRTGENRRRRLRFQKGKGKSQRKQNTQKWKRERREAKRGLRECLVSMLRSCAHLAYHSTGPVRMPEQPQNSLSRNKNMVIPCTHSYKKEKLCS